MKRFFLFSAFVALMSVALLNTSCTEEDVEFNIVGKWVMTVDYNTKRAYDIREDGTCKSTPMEDDMPGDSVMLTWSYSESDNILKFMNSQGEVVEHYMVFDISKNSKECKWMDQISAKRPAYEVDKK